MAIKKCKKGHFYDNRKYKTCPHCTAEKEENGMSEKNKVSGEQEVEKFALQFLMDQVGEDEVTMVKKEIPEVVVPETFKMPEVAGRQMEDQIPVNVAEGEEDEDDQKTVSYASLGGDFVRGWLVCVQGRQRGKDFQLFHGFNKAGAGRSNDIRILGDDMVSDGTHFSVIYEDRKNEFYLLPEAGCSVFLNGTAAEGQNKLKAYDKITAGRTVFEFVPYCQEEKRWE